MIMMLILVVYAVFLLGRSVYDNYRIKKVENQLNSEIDLLNQQNAAYQSAIAYYKSEAYLEKAARIHLNMQKPGEKVIALTEKPQDEIKTKTNNKQNSSVPGDEIPNYSKWINYLLGI